MQFKNLREILNTTMFCVAFSPRQLALKLLYTLKHKMSFNRHTVHLKCSLSANVLSDQHSHIQGLVQKYITVQL